jgi:hypothetical protein
MLKLNELHHDPPVQPAVEDSPLTATHFASIPTLHDTPPTPLSMPTDEHRTATRPQSKKSIPLSIPKPESIDTHSDPKRVRRQSRASAQRGHTSLPSPLEQRATHSRGGSAAGSRGASVGTRSSARKSTTPGPAPVLTGKSTRGRRASQASTYSNDTPTHVRRSSRSSVPVYRRSSALINQFRCKLLKKHRKSLKIRIWMSWKHPQTSRKPILVSTLTNPAYFIPLTIRKRAIYSACYLHC